MVAPMTEEGREQMGYAIASKSRLASNTALQAVSPLE